MLRHKNIDRICCIVLAVVILLTVCLMGAAKAGVIAGKRALGYEDRLFDQSRVHVIDIVMEDWEGFLDTCTSEEYSPCTVIIDGESFSNAGIRGKGNTSLSSVSQYGNDRYSFKIEFDQYQTGMTWHGLDKLSLNNLIQDKTLLKDYVAYTLMNKMGVAAPLCSFAQIRVNGEDWGFYLAVEGVEDSFLKRNHGSDYGELYKPDSMSFGGGRGNGRDFDMNSFAGQFSGGAASRAESDEDIAAEENTGGFNTFGMNGMEPPEGFAPSQMNGMESPERFDPSQMNGMEMPGESGARNPGMPTDGEDVSFGKTRSKGGFGGGSGMGSSDVKLQYTGDDPSGYSNIFGNAKTDITDADQARLIASLKTLTEGETIEEVVDTDAVIRYFVVHNFLCNDDSYTGQMIHNYYLYEEDGVMSMIPWDYNLAFGGFGMGGFGSGSGATGTVNTPIDSLVSSGDAESRPMAAWISADEDYLEKYHEIYRQFVAEVFENGWFEEEMNRVIEMIAPYAEADKNGFFTYDEFLKGSAGLMEFCSLRARSVAGQLAGTIPSTSEGQRADSAALVDAAHIDLSDLGEFGMGGGRDRFGASSVFGGMPGAGAALSERTAEPGEAVSPGTEPEAQEIPSSSIEGARQNRGNMSMAFPGMNIQPEKTHEEQAALLIGSAAVLIIGILFAKCFKGKL